MLRDETLDYDFLLLELFSSLSAELMQYVIDGIWIIIVILIDDS
jgi:hypothetical protein